eukprot:scaffold2986_cov249-Pinguiococcus_pyrenoidosus.AAC.6
MPSSEERRSPRLRANARSLSTRNGEDGGNQPQGVPDLRCEPDRDHPGPDPAGLSRVCGACSLVKARSADPRSLPLEGGELQAAEEGRQRGHEDSEPRHHRPDRHGCGHGAAGDPAASAAAL